MGGTLNKMAKIMDTHGMGNIIIKSTRISLLRAKVIHLFHYLFIRNRVIEREIQSPCCQSLLVPVTYPNGKILYNQEF